MTDQIEAVLFDMDGLLLDSERVARDAFLAAVAPLDVDRMEAEAFFLTLVGSSSAHTRARVAEFLPGADHAALERSWEAAFRSRMAADIPLRPGVAEGLPRLRAAGIRMAVVTSTYGRPARHHLQTAGIIGYFEHVTGGDEVSANKPDPAPYLETAAKMGLDPARCAAFEDSDRGIAAAVASGARAVQIPDLRPPGQPLPELGQRIARDLTEGLALFGL